MTNVGLRPTSPGGLLGRADRRFLATARIEARPGAVVVTDGAGNTTTFGSNDRNAVEAVRHTTHLRKPGGGYGALPHEYVSLVDIHQRELAVLPPQWWDMDQVKAFATSINVPWRVDLRHWDQPPPPRAEDCVDLKPAGHGVVSALPLLGLVAAIVAALVAWVVTGQWLWVGAGVLVLVVGAPLALRFGPHWKSNLTPSRPEEEP